MNQNGQTAGEVDMALFTRNRQLIPSEQLEPFAGQWVAFSADGTRIVASAVLIEDLSASLKKQAIEGSSVVWERL